ncbi:MAG: hypothetical protein ABIR27_08225 [Dokdonella sp.]
MTRQNPGGHTRFDVSSFRKKVPLRWVAATLLLTTAALSIYLTMLDDTWLRVVMAGGDRIGLLAKERNIRLEADRAKTNPPTADVSGHTGNGSSPPLSDPQP